jgi:hypothetical protein
MTAAPAKRKDTSEANAIWITEAWDNKASHDASLSLTSVQQAIAKGRPLIAGFSARVVTTPVGGTGSCRLNAARKCQCRRCVHTSTDCGDPRYFPPRTKWRFYAQKPSAFSEKSKVMSPRMEHDTLRTPYCVKFALWLSISPASSNSRLMA